METGLWEKKNLKWLNKNRGWKGYYLSRKLINSLINIHSYNHLLQGYVNCLS